MSEWGFSPLSNMLYFRRSHMIVYSLRRKGLTLLPNISVELSGGKVIAEQRKLYYGFQMPSSITLSYKVGGSKWSTEKHILKRFTH